MHILFSRPFRLDNRVRRSKCEAPIEQPEGKILREKVGSLAATKNRLGVRHGQAKAGTLPNSSVPQPRKVTFAELVDDANKRIHPSNPILPLAIDLC